MGISLGKAKELLTPLPSTLQGALRKVGKGGALGSIIVSIPSIARLPSVVGLIDKNLTKITNGLIPGVDIHIPISGIGNHYKLGDKSSAKKPVRGKYAGGANNAIENIQSRAKEFARPTKYKVLLHVNKKIPYAFYDEEASFSCSATTLPGKSLITFIKRQGSPNVMKMPYDVVYEDVKITLQLSSTMLEHNLIDSWMGFIYNEKTKTFAYPKDYYSTIDIVQLDAEMNSIKKIRLIDAYPINMSEVTLSYDATNTIETVDVNFAYRYWETLQEK